MQYDNVYINSNVDKSADSVHLVHNIERMSPVTFSGNHYSLCGGSTNQGLQGNTHRTEPLTVNNDSIF